MKTLSDLTTNKRAWQLLALSALFLELIALYFQYVLDLAPCIMCIYQRVAILGVFFAGVIGSIGYPYLLARITAYSFWGVGAIWGLLIAIEHVKIQSSTMSFLYSCDAIPNFPSWAPLHQWLPFFFEATGSCGDINWQFLGFTMPQVMIATYAIYTGVFALILLSRLKHNKIP